MSLIKKIALACAVTAFAAGSVYAADEVAAPAKPATKAAKKVVKKHHHRMHKKAAAAAAAQ